MRNQTYVLLKIRSKDEIEALAYGNKEKIVEMRDHLETRSKRHNYSVNYKLKIRKVTQILQYDN